MGADGVEQTEFWVVMVHCQWRSMETSIGLDLASKMSDGSVGYLPVYETREEAEEAHPGQQILPIRERKE